MIHQCLREGFTPKGTSGGKGSAIQEAARRLGISDGALHGNLRNGLMTVDWSLYQHTPREPRPSYDPPPPQADPEALDKVIASLRKTPMSLTEIAAAAQVSKGQALDAIEGALSRGANIHEIDGKWSLEKAPALREAGKDPDFEIVSDESGVFRFGFVTDNHLGSKYSRLDVLNDLYDRFARRGLTHVYNAGNWIDGVAPFNRHDLLVHGMDAQLRYFAEHYPERLGITTYAVAGDDHEGWFAQREGVDIGRYAEARMRDAGRTDWRYLGYMEADVKLVNAKTGAWSVMRVVHPGGGSAYAVSYSMQKLVESYEGGDKPAVVLGGHYHKQEILNYRNVWIIQGGTTEDQTPFMRKKKLEAHVGGLIVTLEQDSETGAIISCNDMYRYFNRGYYDDRNGRYSMSGDIVQATRTLGGV